MRSFTETDGTRQHAGSTTLDRGSLGRTTLEQQFERILSVQGPALIRVAASYTNTSSDRDDLSQEIAFAIWQALPKFRGECSERTFAFKIAHNRCITYLSRVRAQSIASLDEIEVHDPAPGPEFQLSQRQRAEKLKAAVRRLPITYRQVIVLTLEGLEYKEVSDVLGISEANVGVRLTRARQLLQEDLEKRR
jgi:RNA polymerase sigma factor (sigma-70 family)